MKPIGILGGTFDPVHIAHLRLALEAYEQIQLDRVKLMPCHIPPLRNSTLASVELRLHMLKLAQMGISELEIDDRELKRPGPSYSVDSLKSLCRDYPQTSLCLVLGMDAFLTLDQWNHWQDLIKLAHIAVASRPGVKYRLNAQLENFVSKHETKQYDLIHNGLSGRLIFLDFDELTVSSSRIRSLRQKHKEIRFLVPEKVYHYINEHDLYR